MKRKDTFTFKEEVKELYGDEYSIIGEYVLSNVKIEIRHNGCGNKFEALPSNFLRGHRCPHCYKSIKKTTESYKKELELKYGDEFELLGEYVNNATKIKVRHRKCGNIYLIRPTHLLSKPRCAYCAGNAKKTTKSFNKELENINSKIRVVGAFSGANNKVECTCDKRHIYHATPSNLLKGIGCPVCFGNSKYTIKELQAKMNEFHDGEYTVLERLDGRRVRIKHNRCGNIYKTTIRVIWFGCGCPKCASSKGEDKVRRILEEMKIDFKEQHKFNGCKNKRRLPFDFYLPNNNVCIEYDGEGHYEPFRFSTGQEKFEQTKRHDKIKNKYCHDNSITLIRIPYTKFKNIEHILRNAL